MKWALDVEKMALIEGLRCEFQGNFYGGDAVILLNKDGCHFAWGLRFWCIISTQFNGSSYKVVENEFVAWALYPWILCVQVERNIDTVRICILYWRAKGKRNGLTGLTFRRILTTRSALFSKYHLYPWFPSFALRIPNAHNFCAISARSWARACTKHKRFLSN